MQQPKDAKIVWPVAAMALACVLSWSAWAEAQGAAAAPAQPAAGVSVNSEKPVAAGVAINELRTERDEGSVSASASAERPDFPARAENNATPDRREIDAARTQLQAVQKQLELQMKVMQKQLEMAQKRMEELDRNLAEMKDASGDWYHIGRVPPGAAARGGIGSSGEASRPYSRPGVVLRPPAIPKTPDNVSPYVARSGQSREQKLDALERQIQKLLEEVRSLRQEGREGPAAPPAAEPLHAR